MDNWMKRAVELIDGVVLTSKKHPAVIPFKPQKTEISKTEDRSLRRGVPEKHGVSSLRIYRMLTELEAERRANIHSIMVIKDGVVISECSHPGYSVNTRRLAHSMTKTVTGMAIGLLYDDGLLKLETKLSEIFPEFPEKSFPAAAATVYDLLTMRSANKFAEAGSITEASWTRAFFESGLKSEIGESFDYNSMNSYILAKIVTRVAKKSLTKLLDERIFLPLGITNRFFEIGPEGVEKGGWGLHLSAESWAKLGIMMLCGGVYEGRRILSEKWVKESTRTHAETDPALGDFNYGYQIWTQRGGDEFLFNGMLGQNVWVSPKAGLVVVITAGNNELFQASPALTVMRKHLSGVDVSKPYSKDAYSLLLEKENRFFETRHWIRPLQKKKGLSYLLGLKDPMPIPTMWDALIGEYGFPENNHSLLPALIRIMQNNHTGGIESIKIEKGKSSLKLSLKEGLTSYSFDVGLYDFISTDVDFCGEKYRILAMGEAMEDEDRDIIYKIELIFPEMPNRRMIKLSLRAPGELLVRMSETPNHNLVLPMINGFINSSKKISLAMEMFEKQIGKNFIEKKLEALFAPSFVAYDKGDEDYDAKIAEANREITERLRRVRETNAFVLRFISTDDKKEGENEEKKSFFGEILGFLGRKKKNEKSDTPPDQS